MLTRSNQHHEEDDEIELLRKAAMETLKRGNREISNSQEQTENKYTESNLHFSSQPQPEASFVNNKGEHGLYHTTTFPPVRQPRMNFIPFQQQQRYGPPLVHGPNFPPRHATMRPIAPIPFLQQHRPILQPQAPMPMINPHVNPQFITHPNQPPPFIQNEFPMEYIPTPTIRLSPRSAQFIAENEQAIKKANEKKRSPARGRRSTSRSRSRSPATRRRSSRSPYNSKRRSPDGAAGRKRYRSNSPENRVPPFKGRNKLGERDLGRDLKQNNGNGNGRYNSQNKRSGSDREEDKSEPKRSRSKAFEESQRKVEEETKVASEKGESVTKQPSPVAEEKSTTPPPTASQAEKKREKTQEELEDELLASTDEEDGLDINMDDNELDFLEDDSESENEGRFKGKSSSNVKAMSSAPTLGSGKNSFSRAYDRQKPSLSYNSGSAARSRNDYKFDDKHKRRDHHKGTPEQRKKSPIEVRKRPSERQPITLKETAESERKPLFRSTFRSVETSSSSQDKKNDSSSSTTGKKSVKLVRSFVSKPESDKKSSDKSSTAKSTVKSAISTNDESSKTAGGRKKIMDRLGDFVGAKGKSDGNRYQKQV